MNGDRSLLLLHGSPGQGASWKAVQEHLTSDWSVTVPTLQGHGSGEVLKDLDLPQLATHVLEALPVRDGPYVLAGHSFGGLVCLEIALSGLIAVEAVVLFEPVGTNFLPLAGENALYSELRSFFDDYRAAYEGGDKMAVRLMIDYWFGERAFENMPEFMRDYLVRSTPANVRDVRHSFERVYDPDILRQLTIPISIICGTAGPSVMQKICEATAAAFPNSRLHRLQGANHAMLATHPAAVAGFVNQMLCHTV